MLASRYHDLCCRVRGRAVLLPLLFLAAVLYYLPLAPIGLNVFDEGIRLNASVQILRGEIPYHDYYFLYGPALGYWGAALFKILGVQVMSLREARFSSTRSWPSQCTA